MLLTVFWGCDSSAIEVGPQPQGVVRADIFNIMKQGLDAILDWTETFNSGMLNLRWHYILELHSQYLIFLIFFPIFSPIANSKPPVSSHLLHESYQLKANMWFLW